MPDIWGPHLSAHACTWKNTLSMAGDFCKPTMTPNIQATIILTTGLGPGQVDFPTVKELLILTYPASHLPTQKNVN